MDAYADGCRASMLADFISIISYREPAQCHEEDERETVVKLPPPNKASEEHCHYDERTKDIYPRSVHRC